MKEEIKGVHICTTAYLKKTGFNFSAYDYMANLTIGDITFKNCKVLSEFAFCLNDDGTQVAVISLKESKCSIEKIYLN